jgi:hypothetical protein
MESRTIFVPRDLTLENVIELGRTLEKIDEADEFTVDFQNPGYVTPFGMVFTSQLIKSFINRNSRAIISAINTTNGYAWHMGYFKACGFDIGRVEGKTRGNDKYLPITTILVNEMKEEAKTNFLEIGDVVEKRSKSLAQILTQQETGVLVDMFTYTIREMIRNVVEHSQSDYVTLCGQYMPSKQRAEIAILDSGIGIRASLSSNPHLVINNDHDALILALTPGISGKMYKGKPRDPYDVWQNSGFGLYAVSRLCGFGGKFFICSGNSGLALTPQGKKSYEVNYAGTALRLNLCSKDIKHLQTVLKDIMKEGDVIAKTITGDDQIQASVASRMLAEEMSKLSLLK